jgi:hypothetical protein
VVGLRSRKGYQKPVPASSKPGPGSEPGQIGTGSHWNPQRQLKSQQYSEVRNRYHGQAMNDFKVQLLALVFLASPLVVAAGQDLPGNEVVTSSTATIPVRLADLAAMADVVAVVQMRDGDYRYQRDFPVSGSAYLKMLIPYKVDQPLDLIEVYETGLHENECYFPNPDVFEEGRRYLVFLRRDPDNAERYRGLERGCALDVLVTADSSYALRIPVTGIELADPLMEFAGMLAFADAYSHEDYESLDSVKRDEWLANGWLRRLSSEEGEQLQYTTGIGLDQVRTLMGPAGHSLDRHLKRPPDES